MQRKIEILPPRGTPAQDMQNILEYVKEGLLVFMQKAPQNDFESGYAQALIDLGLFVGGLAGQPWPVASKPIMNVNRDGGRQ